MTTQLGVLLGLQSHVYGKVFFVCVQQIFILVQIAIKHIKHINIMTLINPIILLLVFAIVITLMVFAIYTLISSKIERKEKLLWGIIIILLPLFGSILFISNFYLKSNNHSS